FAQALGYVKIGTLNMNAGLGDRFAWRPQWIVQQLIDPVERLPERDECGRVRSLCASCGGREVRTSLCIAIKPVTQVVGDRCWYQMDQRQPHHMYQQCCHLFRMGLQLPPI